MSSIYPIPDTWSFDTLWACEAKIDWDVEIEINPKGGPLSSDNYGFITKMAIKPLDRGKS